LGFNQIQKMLDEMTQNEINLLERLSKWWHAKTT
jgi:hypothetical protein